MSDKSLLQKVVSYFNLDGSKKETSYIPPKLREDLLNDLEDGESLLKCVQSLSSTYKPKSWLDRNTFFNTFFILTSRRLIIARNSRELKIFRDINLDQIQKYRIETGKKGHNIIEIQSFDSQDTVVIHRTLTEEVEEVKKLIPRQIEQQEKSHGNKQVYCMHCGVKISESSRFCSSCGKKVKV